MVAAARRPASPPGQSPVGPCPFLNAKSEEWRVKSEERKGLLMFHGTLFTLHSSLFTLRILRENGVWLCGQQGFQRPPNRSSYSARRWALWTYCLWQGLLMFHSTLITLHSLLFTLHSSLFTLHSSPFEREHPYETLQPAPWRHQDPPNVHRGVNAHFQCREYAGNRHAHGTLITLHSSLFTLHSSLFEFSGRRGGVS